jgi:hypothetical protein
MKERTVHMIDKRIHYYLVLDVETANGLDDPLVYDIGGVITDKQGRIYEAFSFVIRDIFIYERFLMETAYYANKVPDYIQDLENDNRVLIDFYNARKYILALMEKYNITDVAAYNAYFDQTALNKTQRWLTKSKYRYFFPYGTNFICIWNMACQTLCQRKTYKEFCEKNQLFSGNGHGTDKKARNISTSAENVYRYLILNPNYQEEHKGLDDVLIETEIMKRCFSSHKAMPYGKGIKRNCWMLVKRTV